MSRFPLRRPVIGSLALCLLVSLYLLTVLNLTFWNEAFYVFGGFGAKFFAFGVALILLVLGGVTIASVKYLVKPFLVLLILIAAVSSYYTDIFGVVIDRDMIRNAVVTTPDEAGHLITLKFVLHVAFYGVLPALLVCLPRLRHHRFPVKFLVNMVVILLCLSGSAGLVLANFATIASNIREHRDMMAKLNPFAPIASAIGLGISSYQEIGVVRAPLGQDATLGPVIAKADKPVVTIIVAGETARAMNFSLNGYAKDTNPELEALGVVNYPNTTSCGTATAVSLPCMFSVYPRKQYSHRKAKGTETLMDVLRRAGVDGYWWDNNTGSKGIADLVSFASLTHRKDSSFCHDGDCQDGIFLDELDRKLGSVTKNTVIVLHQIGSHGPAYYLNYPDAYRRFQPDCRTAQLSDCSQAEIVNAYDNTIVYTDHILASVIGLLKKHEAGLDGAMIYMSDHGESLGENGLFLHGAPYAFAPAEQTHVPFIAWFSKPYAALMELDTSCLKQSAAAPKSHDNLFHTVLGMMNVTTRVYDPKLDAFAACRHLPKPSLDVTAYNAADAG